MKITMTNAIESCYVYNREILKFFENKKYIAPTLSS